MASTLVWNGPAIQKKLEAHYLNAVTNAVTYYHKELFKLLVKAGWGSKKTNNFFLRRRVFHSKPGTPPLRQTDNLIGSLRVQPAVKSGGLISGQVYTNVPYANVLEHGGFAVPYRQKPYTVLRLVNPIRIGIHIEPRPAWIINWYNSISRMLRFFTDIRS